MNKEEKEASKKYNFVAEHYHNWRTKLHPQGWMYNEHLEMPATFELLGNIKRKKVLDIGCGAGIYARLLTKKGALVKGFDISDEMLRIAKQDNPKLDLRKGSFYKIPFKEKFDIAIMPLVIGYAEDWDKVFKQVNSRLKTGGYFIFSHGNPVSEIAKKVDRKKNPLIRLLGNYFEEKKIFGKWRNIIKKGRVKDITMHNYHKTYETIIRTILSNGFEIIDYRDCFPTKESRKLFPKEYAFLSKVPYFCIWKVRKK